MRYSGSRISSKEEGPEQRVTDRFPTQSTAKPTNFLVPYRVAAAASISSSSKNSAAQVQPHGTATAHLLNPERREVALASQEGTKGAVQYVLYVCSSYTQMTFISIDIMNLSPGKEQEGRKLT